MAEIVRDYASKMLKIRQFTSEIALVRRFEKKQKAIIRIQNFFRVVKAKQTLRRLKTARLEQERKRMMDIYCRHHKD